MQIIEQLGKQIGMNEEDIKNSIESFKDCTQCGEHKPISSFRYRGGIQEVCKNCAGLSEEPQYARISKTQAEELLTKIMFEERKNISIMGAAKLGHLLDFIKRL